MGLKWTNLKRNARLSIIITLFETYTNVITIFSSSAGHKRCESTGGWNIIGKLINGLVTLRPDDDDSTRKVIFLIFTSAKIDKSRRVIEYFLLFNAVTVHKNSRTELIKSESICVWKSHYWIVSLHPKFISRTHVKVWACWKTTMRGIEWVN